MGAATQYTRRALQLEAGGHWAAAAKCWGRVGPAPRLELCRLAARVADPGIDRVGLWRALQANKFAGTLVPRSQAEFFDGLEHTKRWLERTLSDWGPTSWAALSKGLNPSRTGEDPPARSRVCLAELIAEGRVRMHIRGGELVLALPVTA